MVLPEQEIKKNDLQAAIAVLDTELAEKARDMTGVLLFLDEHEGKVQAFNKEKSDFESYKNSTNEELALKRNELQAQTMQSELALETSKSELSAIESRVRDKAKELVKLNAQCISAQDDADKLNGNIAELNRQIDYLATLVVNIEEKNKELESLSSQKNALELDLYNMQVQSDESLKVKNAELAAITLEVEEKIKVRDQAEYDLKTYTDNLYTAMNDWQIVRSRIEEQWNKTFPELAIPLMM